MERALTLIRFHVNRDMLVAATASQEDSMRGTFVAIPSVVLLLAFAQSAVAQSKVEDQAREQFERGIELFEAGRPEQAAVAFRKAYEMKPSWRILYNLAQAENNADRFAAALWAYTQYLAEGGEEIPAGRVEQVREEVKRLNSLVAMLVIQGGPAGAEVLVDRELKGTTPLDGPLFVDLGRRDVIVDQGGKRIFERVVTVAGGERVVLNLDDGAPRPERLWTWVAAGVGGAALLGTVITGGMAIAKRNDLDEDCPEGACPPSKMSEVDSMKALGNASTALVVVAGVGIAAAVVLFFVEPGFGLEQPPVEVGLGALPGSGFVTIGRRF